MTKRMKKESPIVESRFLWAGIFVILVIAILSIRLWYIQIYKGSHYRQISENNRIRRIEILSPRGMIFDRHGEVVLGNRPFFDLVYIPQFIKDKETTFKILSRLLNTPLSNFDKMLRAGRGRPKFLPITIKRNLSIHEVATIEQNKVFLPGIEVNVAPRRDYKQDLPAHIVGYLGEIDYKTLQRFNSDNDTSQNSYLPGDLVGKQGLEKRWEKYLRGQRGYRLIQVDAFGRKTENQSKELERPIKPAVAGSDLILTLDLKLQKAVTEAFQGKYGAVVVINPKNGDILAMVSSPSYDPSIYQDSLSIEKWRSLINDPYKPLFDKTTGGEFPPGSIYKAVVAIAALEEKVITKNSRFNCTGTFELGGDVFHCHDRNGHGLVGLRRAMVKSCDVFFYNIGVELGVDRIAKYALDLGLGAKLGVRLNKENDGLVPTSFWKKNIYRFPWTVGDTPPISIGQGANLITPIQMASLYATLANNGKIWQPRIVKRIVNHIGEVVKQHEPTIKKQTSLIKPETFRYIRDVLKDVVMTSEGTGKRAQVEGFTVAGKTGSVQVVSLKKNRNQDDVSMRWKEHAMFAAFSPVKDAEIAVAVISENDRIGGGGTSAAPVAGKIIDAYWRLKKERKTTTNHKWQTKAGE